MDSLTKSLGRIKEESKQLITNYRNKINSIPDYSMFSPEIQIEMKEKYLSKVKKEFQESYKDLKFEIDFKSSGLKRNINETKYPFQNKAIGSDERLQIQLSKQRAESLAGQKLDWNILKYLDNEISNNEIDFLFYFQNALNLNTGIDTELKKEINLKIAEVEKSIGLHKINIESQAVELLNNQLENYYKQTESNDPALKLENAYNERELETLTEQLID